MPHWRLSLPPPAAPTLPSPLHRSSSPIAVDSPSRRPLISSCSRPVHRHPSPSITVHRHTVHHCQVAIAPSLSVHHHCDRQSQSIAVTLVLSLTVHRHQRAIAPSIAVKEPSPSRRAVHHRRGAVHRCQSVYCFQVDVAPSIAVHRY